MSYCSKSTISHYVVSKYPSIVENAFELFKNEGCKLGTKSPFFEKYDIMIINGDILEENFCFEDGRNLATKNKSVDVIFATNDSIKSMMQFVELKLKCVNVYSLEKMSFRGKANSSSKALGNSVKISKKYYLIFDESVIEEAIRFLFRINPRLDNDFVALTIPQLHSKFFM